MTTSSNKSIEEIKELAMRDDLFEPEYISRELQYPAHTSTCTYWKLNTCNCRAGAKSLTVRLPDKVKHFSKKVVVTIPAWSEDIDLENECLVL